MNKRTIAIFFMLLANITLLALAIVPHHHHETEICVVGSHCNEEGEIHDHDIARHDHEHDGENSTEYCVLNQVYVIPSNDLTLHVKCLDYADDYVNFNSFQAVLLNTGLTSFSPYYLAKEKPPLLFSNYIQLIQSSCGLRAPPIA